MGRTYVGTAVAAGLMLAGAWGATQAASPADQKAVAAAVAASTRTPANVARDKYRHPVETLNFFGVQPNHTVVEITPGAGWYTEILAPLVRGKGTYYAAVAPRAVATPMALTKTNPALYDHIRMAAFPAGAADPKVPDGTADVVLTFRNVHNWMMGAQPYADEAFKQMYAMLKPGGVLGVVDHRLPEKADTQRERQSGYLKVSTVRRLAESAGFQFAGASEVNANPRDTADWPGGVWTLPPSNRGPAEEREKYLAIGESDRMTLKFVKPRAARR